MGFVFQGMTTLQGRVLILAAEYPPHVGGVSAYSRATAEALARVGWKVRVVTTTPGSANSLIATLQINRSAAILNRKYLKVLPLLVAAMLECIRERPDLILLMKCNHEGIVGLITRRLFSVPYVVVGYGTELVQFGGHPLFRPFVKALFRRAIHLIAISTYTEELMAQLGAPSSRLSVIHPTVDVLPDPAVAPPDEFGLGGRRVVLTVARLVSRKGHDRVLEAMTRIRAEFPSVLYVIAGDGPERARLSALVRAHGLEDNVRFVGSVSDGTLESLYAACEFFIMTSRQEGSDVEGFGIVFLQAAIRGKPSIAGRSGGAVDAVLDGATGLLVDPRSTSQIADALTMLLSDPAYTKAMGRRARVRALENFTAQNQESEIDKVFKGLRPKL